VTTSVSRSSNIQDKYVKYMNANHILAGGSGRKISLVIKGEADMMAYVGASTSKWDSCAG
jgi:3'-phosphoadenosine 5'-phosphosulfate (PAPS) 3'-phosphatase